MVAYAREFEVRNRHGDMLFAANSAGVELGGKKALSFSGEDLRNASRRILLHCRSHMIIICAVRSIKKTNNYIKLQ